MSTPPTTKAKPRTNPASDPQPPRFSSDVALATTDVANATIDVAYATNCSHGYIPIATFRCRTLFAAQGHSALPRFYLAKSPRPPAQSRFPPDAAIPNRADRKPRIPDPISPLDLFKSLTSHPALAGPSRPSPAITFSRAQVSRSRSRSRSRARTQRQRCSYSAQRYSYSYSAQRYSYSYSYSIRSFRVRVRVRGRLQDQSRAAVAVGTGRTSGSQRPIRFQFPSPPPRGPRSPTRRKLYFSRCD